MKNRAVSKKCLFESDKIIEKLNSIILMIFFVGCWLSVKGQIDPDTLNFSRSNSGFFSDVYNGERGVSFNNNWKFNYGDAPGADKVLFNDAAWRIVKLPHDWSGNFSQTDPRRSV